MTTVERILAKVADQLDGAPFEQLETDTIELKAGPVDAGSWRKVLQSVNAFANSRGGLLFLGIVEEEGPRRYSFRGWRPEQNDKMRSELTKAVCDERGRAVGDTKWLRDIQLHPFRGGQVCVAFVDEMPDEDKHVYFEGKGWRRSLDSNVEIKKAELDAQRERREEWRAARELKAVEGATISDLDVHRLNEFIQLLNRQTRGETLKPTMEDARPFLDVRRFMLNDRVTTLGMLVCGKHPEKWLDFRCQVHCYENAATEGARREQVARDKKIVIGNVLHLIEDTLAWLYQRIRVGVTTEAGGKAVPVLPEEVLRETLNNAVAHRDYHENRPIFVDVLPDSHVEIRNPGSFRSTQMIHSDQAPQIHRIVPDPQPRNPKLAQVLNVYTKWEGHGIGMSTLTNLCLDDRIDLPCYRAYTATEIGLRLSPGPLVDESMKYLFDAFDGYLREKLGGRDATDEERRVLAYLVKSQMANDRLLMTINLTPDNNHFNAIRTLREGGLVSHHPASTPVQPVFVVDPILVRTDFSPELRRMFGAAYDDHGDKYRQVLEAVYRLQMFSKEHEANAKRVSFLLYFKQPAKRHDVREFDLFYRSVRERIVRLHKSGMLLQLRPPPRPAYRLNDAFKDQTLV